ncbi:MAG: signal peptidase I [Candidatus Aminicenantes bacterium]|nr:MAG: signal peptidase I [Candidatus Aminicenantes bacterium]
MEKRKIKQYLKYIIINLLIAAGVSIFLITYVASAYKIEGNSMETVLSDQERVIISKWRVKNNINRYDIIVLYKPDEPKKSIIKRVIGLPGEIIEIREGDVYINGKKLREPYLPNQKDIMFRSINMKPLLIQKDHYFVIGDNRPVSQDSRVFGPVSQKYIYGKTIFRYWPFSRFGKVE